MDKFNDSERFGKYPDVFIWGKPVTSIQAEDIIRKTDYTIFENVGLDCYDNSPRGRWLEWSHKVLGLFIGSPISHMEDNAKWRLIRGPNGLLDHVKMELGCLRLQYFPNFLAYSSRLSGWCDPSGDISMAGFTGSKWPTDKEMFNEWKLIAKAFPFLDLTCSVMGDERGDKEPKDYPDSVTYRVKNGKVKRVKFANPPVIYRIGILDRLLDTFHDLRIPGDINYLEPPRSISNGLPAPFFIRTGLMTRPIVEEWMKERGIFQPGSNVPEEWKSLTKWDEENGVFWTLE